MPMVPGKTTFIETLTNPFSPKRDFTCDTNFTYNLLPQIANYGNVKLINLVTLLTKLNQANLDINNLFTKYSLQDFKTQYFQNCHQDNNKDLSLCF
ncbi:hypothetical protein [Spiroplasma clarkii]|uniref:hypothetical protein n=1 Tax=Spiroplasma clarkii TaxID=2139 RepID=UPI001649F8CD|nr:hypothetical protein [Spiroplasma clarkii]